MLKLRSDHGMKTFTGLWGLSVRITRRWTEWNVPGGSLAGDWVLRIHEHKLTWSRNLRLHLEQVRWHASEVSVHLYKKGWFDSSPLLVYSQNMHTDFPAILNLTVARISTCFISTSTFFLASPLQIIHKIKEAERYVQRVRISMLSWARAIEGLYLTRAMLSVVPSKSPGLFDVNCHDCVASRIRRMSNWLHGKEAFLTRWQVLS